jgi:hypothetical protein
MKSIYLFVFIVLLSFTFVPVPFARSEKEMPSGNWVQIIPKYIDNYKQVALQLPTKNRDGFAAYKKGTQVVRISFNKLNSETLVEKKMNMAKANSLGNRGELSKTELGGSNKFVLYGKNEKYFFAWNRGLYYFDVTCKNGKDEMDAFMKAFPF